MVFWWVEQLAVCIVKESPRRGLEIERDEPK